MGIQTVLLINHANFPVIYNNKKFGEILHKTKYRDKHAQSIGVAYLGEYTGNRSVSICYQSDRICSFGQDFNSSTTLVRKPEDQTYSVITVSGDHSSGLVGQSELGFHLISALRTFMRDPKGNPINLEPYGQAITLITTIPPQKTGMVVLEGGCSWVVGQEETPPWARVNQTPYDLKRDVLELMLALKHGVNVDFSRKYLVSLIKKCF